MKKKPKSLFSTFAPIALLTTLVCVGILNYMPAEFKPLPLHPANPMMTQDEEVITLTSETVVNFRGPVNDQSVADVLSELLAKREDTNETIYLFINSPGGSIIDGIAFIRAAKRVPNVKTVTIFAASMAHAIAQQLPGERIILPTGIAMAHRAAGRFQGQFEQGELEQQLALWKKIVLDLELKNAKRLGISIQEYKAKVKDEWWSYGSSAVDEGVMDSVKEFRCTNELIKDVQSVGGVFGSQEFSQCPLLTYPVIN